MLFAELRASLKEKIHPSYVMTGSDIFLINKSIELILAAAGVDAMGVIGLDESVTIDEINVNLPNISMFGGGTAVVIRGVEQTHVILKPIKDFKTAQKVDCNPMTENLVVRLIMQNKKFPQDSAFTLARMCENNYAMVANEIEKLVNYYHDKESIASADIEKIVNKTEKYQIYELSNALVKKDSTRAQNILQTLISSGVDEYAIFGGLVSFVRRLFYCKSSGLSDAELGKFLGCNPYAITATRRDARAMSRDAVMLIYQSVLELEYKIKSGKITTHSAIVMTVGAML